jgi:UDP-N-acetylglucosamine diphosphorylase/glucosamine-1-phosphate N-acetyltransferase
MKVLVMAAGKGKRLGSEQTGIPKVMRKACGKPLLHYILSNTDFVGAKDKLVIVGFKKEVIFETFPFLPHVVQEEQKGTGHAVMCAEEALKDYDGDIMVVNGDMPLIRRETLLKLSEYHAEKKNDCTILTCVQKEGEIMHYGRILRDENGNFTGVVEQKDATEEQKAIRELNIGMYVFDCKKLFEALKKVSASRATGEYYITDVPHVMKSMGLKVDAFSYGDIEEFMGVNTEEDLKTVETLLEQRK